MDAIEFLYLALALAVKAFRSPRLSSGSWSWPSPLQDDDIMHVAAQKDLQRTAIYSADAHEMSFR
jgi:hypothetical protein